MLSWLISALPFSPPSRPTPPPCCAGLFCLQEHNIRSTMIQAIQKEFPHLNMTYSIGGQLSFDVFPTGEESGNESS